MHVARDLQLSQLRAFVETCRTGSFTRAAELLFISQPALHRKVRQLERDLGVTLLAVRNRRVVPTEVGLKVLDVAERMVTEIHALESYLWALTREVRVGAVSLVAAMVLPMAIKTFSARNPQKSVTLRSMEPDQLIDALFDGTIAVGITYESYVSRDLHSELLWTSPVVCVAASNHPLDDGKPHSAEELLDFPLALTLPGMGLRTMIESWFEDELGITALPVAFEASTGALLAQYTSASRTHITFLPLPSLKHFNLVQIPLTASCPEARVVICRLANAPLSRDAEELISILLEIANAAKEQLTLTLDQK